MAEPASLLCVVCARPPPAHRRTWGRCMVCVERNLPSTYYCGEECMNAHWPKHKVWHKEQKERDKEIREGAVRENDRSALEAQEREAERTGSEFAKRCAAAVALMAEGDHHAADKAWRRLIKQRPEEPTPYHNLALVMGRSGRNMEAAPMYLKASELFEEGSKGWADSAACAFDLLMTPDGDEMPKPDWWNDEALKALSARMVALAPGGHMQCGMRARVLCGGAISKAHWNVGPRTAAEIKEAATWYRRAARVSHTPADKQRHQLASQCDEYADPLLAKEEAEAAVARAAAETEAERARAAAEAEAAEALKVAEAKAKAAAEELLADEEKAKQQATASTTVGKAKQGKGKKGKGKR